MKSTADLIDIAPQTPSCSVQFRSLGRIKQCCGRIRTIRCYEDNGLVKQVLNTPSNGEILVVDGAGSLRSALMGDQIAAAGLKNGWAGVIIFGAVRDSIELDKMNWAIKALGTNPKKSAKDGQGECDVSVTFGDVCFTPGYFLYSDEDGILVSAELIK